MPKSSRILVLLFLCSALLAQERKIFWDGNDWLAIDKISAQNPELNFWIKSAYLSGLFDGKLFYKIKAFQISPTLSDSVFNDLVTPAPSKRLIAGIDMLYRDPANRYLPLPNALIATLMFQEEFSPAEIQNYINNSKKWINTLQFGE